jgi:hypothetical protein
MKRIPVTRLTRSRTVVLLAVAVVAAAVGGSIAWATIPDAGGVIHACYGGKGALRVIDDSIDSCKPTETALAWNVQGQPGLSGVENVVVHSDPNVPNGPAFNWATAQCPAGKRVIGGGGAVWPLAPFPPMPVALVASLPTSNATGWGWFAAGSEMSPTDAEWHVEAVAICANVGP